MEWMVKCRSKSGTGVLRERTLPAHSRYLDNFSRETWFSGPLFSDDNTTAIGSFRLIDLPDRAAARRYIDEDPYTTAEIFEAIDIVRWRPLLDLRQRDCVRREGTQQWLVVARLAAPAEADDPALGEGLAGFAGRHGETLLACGPLLDDDGATARATLALFDVASRAEVDRLRADDPLAADGRYGETAIERWRFGHV